MPTKPWQIGSKIGLKSTVPYTVFEVTNTDGQRALRAKERILDTVGPGKNDEHTREGNPASPGQGSDDPRQTAVKLSRKSAEPGVTRGCLHLPAAVGWAGFTSYLAFAPASVSPLGHPLLPAFCCSRPEISRVLSHPAGRPVENAGCGHVGGKEVPAALQVAAAHTPRRGRSGGG